LEWLFKENNKDVILPSNTIDCRVWFSWAGIKVEYKKNQMEGKKIGEIGLRVKKW
jgi:hypothetical protein